MVTKEIAIEAIKEKLEVLSNVHNATEFKTWKKITENTLRRVVPYNKTIFKNIESIKAIDLYTGVDITPKAKEQGKLLIESLIKDIERFGLEKPEPTEKESFIRVDVNQTNQQTQSTTVSINIEFILEILKGELRNSEIEELKEILDSSDKPKEKKK